MPIGWPEAELSNAVVDAYAEAVETLLDQRDGGASTPHVVTLTPSGREAFRAFAQALYETLNDPALPANLHGPFAKFEGYGARLALILQEARRACGDTHRESVEAESVLGAAALIHYFQAHARRVYERLQVTPEDRRLEQVVAWIRAHGQSASARDLVTHRVAGVKSSSEAKALLHQLQDCGYGTVDSPSKSRVRFTLMQAP